MLISKAQCKVAVILAVAHFGNVWEPAYPRNDNHDPKVFWIVNALLAVGTVLTWQWKASSVGRSGGSPRVVMLGREQTEEWKGWMQVSYPFHIILCTVPHRTASDTNRINRVLHASS